MSAVAVQVSNKLPDGRQIRALEGTFKQIGMFRLHSSGLFVPAQERIMTLREHDQSIQSGAYEAVNVNNWWRTAEYGFYPKGFEKEAIPIGNQLVYVENGVFHTLEISDVPVKVNGENISLRRAVGMGIMPLERLQIEQVDETHFKVSVTSDFDPANDVKVVDIIRPRGWAMVDENGYPLRSSPSTERVPDARYFSVTHEDEFEKGSTGYHGSLVRGFDNLFNRLGVGAGANITWSFDSGVALVCREATV